MKVREIMTRDVRTVAPDTTVREAARLMKDLDVGPLPVVEGKKVVGMVTDRDIVVRCVAAGANPDSAPVRDAMSTNVLACPADDDEKDAARLMKDHQVRRLIVLDDAGGLAGILSLGDLAVETGKDRMSGKVLEEVSEPAMSRR